jgi:hypothetical protein
MFTTNLKGTKMGKLTELRYEEAARAKMIKWLTEEPDYLLYNLTSTNLGLDSAIRVIAEFVEKRVELKDFEETAWRVAKEAFGFFLEGAGCPDAPTDFAKYMAEWWMPFVELPDGEVIYNDLACQIWQGGCIP